MFSLAVSICLAISATALLLHGLSAWTTYRHTRARPRPTVDLPPLTLLKPIKGLEEALELNLRSFFEQRYPAPLHIVFASTEAHDAGIEVARRVAGQYPDCRVSFVVSDASFGRNPKVSNLAGALAAAAHDLVMQTDANVRIRPGYLQAAVEEFLAEGASLSGALVTGSGEHSIGAALDNIQLSTFLTPGICLAYRRFGITCVVGKAILFRKTELESLGGLATVKDVLAEDFVLGETYGQAGKRVLLSRLAVDNINVEASVQRFAARHSRWLKMRVVLHAVGFVADLLSNASFFALLAAALSGGELHWVLGYLGVATYKGAIDARLLAHLRGHPLALRHWLCLPLRDLILPALWLHALFSRTTEWRGERFRLIHGSQIIPLPPDATALSALHPSSGPSPARPPAEHRG
ncbi:MAG: glycosyltransferase [Polyangiales bacterium]